MKKTYGLGWVAGLALAAQGAWAAPEAVPAPIGVYVSIVPQFFIVEEVGGPQVEVTAMVPKGRDPHDYEPTPQQVAGLGTARLYFEMGMPFEKTLVAKIKAAGAAIEFVPPPSGLILRQAAGDHAQDGAAGDQGVDPHAWLSIPNLMVMTRAVAEALAAADPEHANLYRTRADALKTRLDALHTRIAQQLAPFRGQSFYVYHPAFGYFADSYGVVQAGLEVEGKSPAPKQIADFIHRARKAHVKVVFVQPQFNPRSADIIARALDGRVATLDPLAEDVPANLQSIADQLEAAFRAAP